MATIDSVKFYMSRTASRTGWNIYCSIRAVAVYTSDPGNSAILGTSDAVLVDNVPLHGSQDWVEFTFSTPVDIGSDGFYAVQIWGNTSDYQVAGVRTYDSTVWSDATGGTPYLGKERGWRYKDGSWASGITPAYQVICTDSDGNSALTPTTTYDTLGEYDATDKGGTAVRSYISLLPGNPHTPVPAHEATEVTSFTLSWEDGGNTDTFDVYFRAFGEFFEKIASDIVDLSVSVEEFLYGSRYNYGELYLWCVIAKNEYGVNHAPPSDFGIGYGGTIWEFNASTFKPPLPSGVTLDYSGDSDDEGWGEPTGTPTGRNVMLAVKRLVAAANDKIWYESI